MDLMYLWHSLLRKKWIIALCTLIGLLAGFGFTLTQKKSYLSFSQYSTGFTMEQKVRIKEEAGLNIYEIDLRFNNVIETFRSPKVMGMLSYKLLLHDLDDSHPFRVLTSDQRGQEVYKVANLEAAKSILRDKISSMSLISPYDPEEKKVYDLILLYGYNDKALSDKIAFTRVERTDFINISYASENPLLSAYVVNTIGEQFIRFFNNIYGARAVESTAKLDSFTNSKKREVDELTGKLRDFRAKIGTPNVADRASAAMGVVQEMTSNYQREMANLNNLRGELTATETQLRSSMSGAGGTTTSTGNNAEYLRLKRENENLDLQKAGKSEDEMKNIQDKIDANVRKMQAAAPVSSGDKERKAEKSADNQAKLINRKIELQEQILAAEQNVKLYREQKDKYEALTSSGGGEEVILKSKEEELRIASQEYEALKKSLQASLDLDVNPENNFKQTMVGQPAFKPEPAKRTIIMGMSGILVFFLSAIIILGLEFLDSSYKTPSIFHRITRLKLLSSLNRIDLKKKELKEHLQLEGEPVRKDEDNLFVENLRKLRYELEKSGRKVILITSTKPNEGKTTVIEALAHSLSLTRKKVLIVDANFSNNSLTRMFEAKPALTTFSAGEKAGPEAFLSITNKTSIPHADVIGCVEGNFTPSEALPPNNLLENISRVAERYDYVLIEGSSLNEHADSKELARYADAIIAVVDAKSVLKQTDKDSIDYLKSTDGKFIGTVLNNVEPDNMEL
ncbi:AAA family ATPase [Pseudoflavitalea sp. G-6-1-2]|uniref:exopolysaccharide transport family protein n=1 Tax=Pseudoflavitalea sp. G-6-1-2 TaxID=2728841 RepID=UPI00146D4BEB|nr:polysaccharide biosynthesis tyrosine autokinase [Pseudoflavitalea sp. G-6-1-2]NML19336.1 AAA family ATPase [Pseudoflavitalea sp. G-6-1-2]